MDDHFVTWGISKETVLPYNGNRIFAPLKEHEGKNLVTFAGREGRCWSAATAGRRPCSSCRGRPYVMHQSVGRGHVIAFADDPTYRAFSPQLQRLFFNAVFFSLPTKRELP